VEKFAAKIAASTIEERGRMLMELAAAHNGSCAAALARDEKILALEAKLGVVEMGGVRFDAITAEQLHQLMAHTAKFSALLDDDAFKPLFGEDPVLSKQRKELLVLTAERVAGVDRASSHGNVWSPNITRFASFIHHTSAASLDALRALVPLPSASCLGREATAMAHMGGVGYSRLQAMSVRWKLLADSLPVAERDVAWVLRFDAVTAVGGVYLNPSRGLMGWKFEEAQLYAAPAESHEGAPPGAAKKKPRTEGGPTTTLVGETATKIMVCRAACAQLPGAEFEVGMAPLGAETGTVMAAFECECREAMAEAGFNVRCLSWDGGSANRTLSKHLVASFTDEESRAELAAGNLPSYFISHCSGLRVFIVSDPDHTLKCARNAAYNSGKLRSKFGVKDEDRKWVRTLYDPSGCAISWEHVKAAYTYDKFANGTLCATYLSERAVMLRGPDDMRVSFALAACSPGCTNLLLETGRPSYDGKVPRFSQAGPFQAAEGAGGASKQPAAAGGGGGGWHSRGGASSAATGLGAASGTSAASPAAPVPDDGGEGEEMAPPPLADVSPWPHGGGPG
jgi:hypothetical protein